MAELFLKVSRCHICLSYLESPKPYNMDTCCFRCIHLVPKNPYEGIVMCPACSEISWENAIKSSLNLGRLVSKVKDLEPQMRGILQMNPRMLKFQVDKIMDVDTANEFLIVSDDLRSVQSELIKQKQQKHAESFSHALCVLGFSRFTSGLHYREVDVRASKEWTLGICKESVNRKGRV
ncbi:ret finger protein-like 1 [Choloepus didactylus]|uniref:ret finger protein-like 1 n=1 Tax=Choloepus didactylus TaxID=27675 RepID=UPI0018A0BA37|nr:ret finger protein-like 1 [Choloepus didactylus]